jgi:hypothetical protein
MGVIVELVIIISVILDFQKDKGSIMDFTISILPHLRPWDGARLVVTTISSKLGHYQNIAA